MNRVLITLFIGLVFSSIIDEINNDPTSTWLNLFFIYEVI